MDKHPTITRPDHRTTVATIPAGAAGGGTLAADLYDTALLVGAAFCMAVRPGVTVVTVTGGPWTPGARNYVTRPWAGHTYVVGTLPPEDGPRPAWHPSYGTTPPLPVADRGCGCDGR